jgi:hypothetical protein
MGNESFYVMGIYIPPNCTTGVDNLLVAWEACLANCTPLVIEDLNIHFEDPVDDRTDDILDLLEKFNINNISRKHKP